MVVARQANNPTIKIYTHKFLRFRLKQTTFLASTTPRYSTFATKTDKFVVFCNTQITSHGKNGNIKEAESVFHTMPTKTIVSYTAMLTAYAGNGQVASARKVFDEMPQRTVASWNAMITAYVRNVSRVRDGLDEAIRLFTKMPERNAVSYSAMVMGFVNAGRFDDAWRLYDRMPLDWRDPFCSNILLNGYLIVGKLEEAVKVFDGMLEKNVVSLSSMVKGYCKNGRISEARRLFDLSEDSRNEYTWCAMIDGYMKTGQFDEGFNLFMRMRREGQVGIEPTMLTVVFESCGRTGRYREGCQVHGLVSRLGLAYNLFLGNSLVAMYSKFGCVDEARNFFNIMKGKDIVSWNSLIHGYVQVGRLEEAHKLFQKMETKDSVSWTTLIMGFSSKGLIEKCIDLFNQMPEHDDVSWTALISGLVNNGEYEEAIRWFHQMLRRAFKPSPLTFSSLLRSSANLASLSLGQQIQALVIKMDMEHDLSIQTSIISMYSKCGNVDDACKIFKSITAPNIVSFNSMITGFAQNGYAEEALQLFRQLVDEGREPDNISFLGVLSACTHMGLVEEGWRYFRSMKTLFNVEQGADHYACMVDLLGKAGLLDEAKRLIESMPFQPHIGVWGALLGASRMHMRLDLGELAARSILELQPDNATPYVVLSDIYSFTGKRRAEEELRLAKRLRGIRKSPGCSWITVKHKVKSFLSGDESDLNFEDIKTMLLTTFYEMSQLDHVDIDWLPP